MATNNATNTSSPPTIAQGGTGQTTATAAFNALSPLTTKGDIVVFDGTNNVRLPVGSDGAILTADSSQTTGLKYNTTSGLGDFQKISTQTASNSALISFTNLSSAYLEYKLVVKYLVPATNNTTLNIQFSTDNGSSYISTAAYYSFNESIKSTTTAAASSGTASLVVGVTTAGFGFTNGTGEYGQANILFYNAGVAGYPYVLWDGGLMTGSAALRLEGGGSYQNSITYNAIKLAMSSGNITSGTFTLYGLVA